MAATIAHVDITGPQADALHTFYRSVLGWQVTPRGPGYALVSTPDGGPDGAIVEGPDPSVTLGVAVPDLAASVAAAVAAGGAEVMPVTDNGWVVKAQVTDPAGNLLTFIQA